MMDECSYQNQERFLLRVLDFGFVRIGFFDVYHL